MTRLHSIHQQGFASTCVRVSTRLRVGGFALGLASFPARPLCGFQCHSRGSEYPGYCKAVRPRSYHGPLASWIISTALAAKKARRRRHTRRRTRAEDRSALVFAMHSPRRREGLPSNPMCAFDTSAEACTALVTSRASLCDTFAGSLGAGRPLAVQLVRGGWSAARWDSAAAAERWEGERAQGCAPGGGNT